MGKPITEAVYLRDMQRQGMSWLLEKLNNWNESITNLHQQSLTSLSQTMENDASSANSFSKVANTLPTVGTTTT